MMDSPASLSTFCRLVVAWVGFFYFLSFWYVSILNCVVIVLHMKPMNIRFYYDGSNNSPPHAPRARNIDIWCCLLHFKVALNVVPTPAQLPSQQREPNKIFLNCFYWILLLSANFIFMLDSSWDLKLLFLQGFVNMPRFFLHCSSFMYRFIRLSVYPSIRASIHWGTEIYITEVTFTMISLEIAYSDGQEGGIRVMSFFQLCVLLHAG